MKRYKPTRWIPPGAETVTRDGVEAIVYTYTTVGGELCAVMYGGKRSKADKHFTYRNDLKRQKAIETYFDSLAGWAERKAARAAERKGFRHSFQVGDILHYSWGYDQTQCEFYQVVATTEHAVTIREIGSRVVPGSGGFMCENRVACPGAFLDDAAPMVKRPQPCSFLESGRGIVPMDFGSASLWDGSPEYCSWYA